MTFYLRVVKTIFYKRAQRVCLGLDNIFLLALGMEII
jgi:hypothetical protein